MVPSAFIENVFAQSVEVLTSGRHVDVRCYLDGTAGIKGLLTLTAEIRDNNRMLKTGSAPVRAEGAEFQPSAFSIVARLSL